jgi:hypothetical protein
MGHQYRIREIALQAGLSEATVDRVLNRRGGVRASTVHEVHQAIADLDRQYTQLRLGGRTFMVDVVMQAPERFSCGPPSSAAVSTSVKPGRSTPWSRTSTASSTAAPMASSSKLPMSLRSRQPWGGWWRRTFPW